MSVQDLDLFKGPQERGLDFPKDFDALRTSDPVHWIEQNRCWVLTRHEDVAAMMMNRFPLTKSGREDLFFAAIPPDERDDRIPTLKKHLSSWIVNTDGPDHARYRKMLVAAFKRPVIEAAREFARTNAARLLDELIPRDEFEFNEEFARPMAGRVLFKLIGLPEEAFPDLQSWAIAMVEAFGGAGIGSAEKLVRAEAAVKAMNALVLQELGKRRIAPQNDILTTLLQASDEAGAEALTVDEILSQMQVLIIAGHDTTANTMTLAIEAFSRNPDALDFIRSHPDRIEESVAEIQRYVAMSGGQTRVASEDFVLHGREIKRGQPVVGVIMAADRDPEKFDRPDELLLDRDNGDMMVFAPGPRHCIGRMLARMQLTEVFSAIASRVASVEVMDRDLKWMPVFVFRGLYGLPVRFHPRVQ